MLTEAYNFLQLTETLMSSGMPTAEQLAEAARSGVQVVINLALPTSEGALPDERGLVESLGMQYIGIPVEWEHPTREDLDAFMNAMDSRKASKVLVHCQANYRASGFIALHRVLRLGWKPDEAFQDLRRIWNPDDYPVWKQFIDENVTSGR